jgi:hypothetical protein
MRNEQVQTEILRYLYSSYCKGYGVEPVGVDNLIQECKLDEKAVWTCLELLKEENLIRHITADSVGLTTSGILYAEEHELVPAEKVKENWQARKKILNTLAEVREELGSYALAHWSRVASQAGIDESSCLRNIYVLIDMGLAQWGQEWQDSRITLEGLRQVNKWRQHMSWAEEYERLVSLEGLSPQERGHKLERLLVQIVEADGWECELNVRGLGEEHDIVIRRDREYYLMECKWHKTPIEPISIREFRDRVSSRAQVHGIFVSISGYTGAALQDARERLSDCMILLFGRKDVEAVLSGDATFTQFLNSKIDAAVKRRKILVDATS